MSLSERIATVLNNKRKEGGNMAFYEYGWTTPDSRIFYKDGTVTEINKRKGVR